MKSISHDHAKMPASYAKMASFKVGMLEAKSATGTPDSSSLKQVPHQNGDFSKVQNN